MKLFLPILMLCCFLYHATAQEDPRLAGLDEELETVLSTWRAAGFAVAIVEKDKLIYAKGFGYRDYENQVPVDENTLFAIGSCSKAFTTSLLGMLEAEEKLDWEASPSTYIPEMRFVNNELNAGVTIRDMITHGTGLPRHDFSWYLFPTYNKDSLLMRIAFQEPFAKVRERWYYNNFMYLAQGVLAERITGKSWEDNLRERIFRPLNMDRSNLSIAELEKSDNAAFGYQLKEDSLIEKMDYYRIAGMAPAGSINSSVKEMANWLQVWINGGKFEGKEILPAAYLREAISSQRVVNNGLPSPDNPGLHFSNYGFAWFLSSYKGHYRVEHGGNIDGFSANTSFFPTDSIGIVVLVNQNGSAVPSVVRNIISDRLLKVERTDWNTYLKAQRDKALQTRREAQASASENRVKGTRPSHILQAYSGTYSNPGYGTFRVSVSGDSLFAIFPLEKDWLRHYHYDVFEPFEVTDSGIDTSAAEAPKFNFYTGISGDVEGVKVEIEPALDQPIDFKREPLAVEVESSTLANYTGAYELPGQVARFYTKNEGTGLFLSLPGQPEYELIPTGEGQFAIRGLQGYKLEFEGSPGAKATAVRFIQPNGTFKAVRKE